MAAAVIGRQQQLGKTIQRTDASKASPYAAHNTSRYVTGHGGPTVPVTVNGTEKGVKIKDVMDVNAGNAYYYPTMVNLFQKEKDISYSSGSECEMADDIQFVDSDDSSSSSNGRSENSRALNHVGSDFLFGGDAQELVESLISSSSVLESKIREITLAVLEAEQKHAPAIYDAELGESSRSYLRRRVMSVLKLRGLKAAVCKSFWEHARSSPGGAYEYIDVLTDCEGFSDSGRIVVDIHFRDQFVIAKATTEYQNLLNCIPEVFVGRTEVLKRVVEVMTEAMRQSAKALGLHLPPWRKPDYVQAKWFSQYKRTTNDVPYSSFSSNDIFSANYNSLPPVVEPEMKTSVVNHEVDSERVKGQLSLAFGR